MSDKWIKDIQNMHQKFGVKQWFEENKNDRDLMDRYLRFRLSMCKEELDETLEAIENKDPEEIVDGLIDLCVFAIGTLEVFDVDAEKAWDQVYNANMAKEPGVKDSRPNPWGMPDLIKPSEWVPPSHEGNHGDLDKSL